MANHIESASAGHQRFLFCSIWRGLVIYPPVVLVLHPKDQRVAQAFAGPLCDGPQPRPGGAGRGRSGSQGWCGAKAAIKGEAPAHLGEPARPCQNGDQRECPGGAKMEQQPLKPQKTHPGRETARVFYVAFA